MRLWTIYHGDVPDFLADCARTPVVARLRDVGMNCGCEYTSFARFRGLAKYSRLDHSVGAALIVWHFTGDRAQAVAALLHDVATPVFAHVVDFLRGDYLAQEATEAGTEAMIAGCEALQARLAALGLSTGDVSDYHRYPIADNDSPRLSADRLEYTLGNCVNYGVCDAAAVRRMYGDLAVGADEDGRPELVFRDAEIAGAFARAALCCSNIYVSDEDRYAMQLLAELLGDALARGVIAEGDLYATEPAVIDRIAADARSAALWRDLLSYDEIVRADAPGTDDAWRKVFAKKRCIDPMVRGRGRVSEIFPAFADELRAFREASQDYWICGRQGGREGGAGE